MSRKTTLVLGGTGKTGRRVAERLSARGLPVRVGSRSGAPPFDWESPQSWAAAVQGVEAAYISYYPDVAAPGAVDKIRSFRDLAVKHGVARLVLLSGRGEPEAERCEEVIAAADADWTIVRSSWFCQNFSESFLLDSILAGEVVLPVGSIGEPFVNADDIADVAVAALTEQGHAGQLYEVTGPRLLTFSQAVAEIARATGRDIRYEQVSTEHYASELATRVPPDVATLLLYLFTEVMDGRNAQIADGVQRALGRAPRDFSDYVRNAATTGVWNAAVPAT